MFVLHYKLNLEIAVGKGYKKVLVETDSLLAIKEIEKGYSSLCEWGNIVCDICLSLAQCDEGLVGHVKREANSLAHNLAKMVVSEDHDMFRWRELLPSYCNSVST